MENEGDIQLYLEFVAPHYSGRDTGHDVQHIKRIFGRLNELSEGFDPPPVLHKLNFLSAFHGLIDTLSNDSSFREQTTRFLENNGWQSDDILASFASLSRHLSDPQTVEERIVHDANFFEVTGTFGIAKAFTVGGKYRQTYEQTLDIFQANLEKLTFRTPVGGKIYEARKAAALVFIRDLRIELTNNMAHPDHNDVPAQEAELLDPNIRCSTARVDELLDDEFKEIGSSGRIFDKATTLAQLQEHPGFDGARTLTDCSVRPLSPTISLITYRSPESRTLRSSIWRFDGRRWRMVFHQGTPDL